MAKKILLDARAEPAYFSLIGISCHLKDYRLSYLLNQQLEFSLSKLDDLPHPLPGAQEPAEFSYYYYRDEDRRQTWSLIANRSQDAVLIPPLKQTDFLLLVEGEFRKAQKEEVLHSIRIIPNVLTAFEVSLSEVRNPEILLTDIEMHLMKVFTRNRNKYQPKLKSTGGSDHV